MWGSRAVIPALSALWALAGTGAAAARPTDWCEIAGSTYTAKVYVVGDQRFDVSLPRCRTSDDAAAVFTFSPNERAQQGALYDDNIQLDVATAPDGTQGPAGWIASRTADDDGVLADRTDELVARQVAIWSYIYGPPETSLTDSSVLDKNRVGPDGQPAPDPAIIERARALRSRAQGQEPEKVYTNYSLDLRLVRKTFHDFKVRATLHEGREAINDKTLDFYVNDRKVASHDTRNGEASFTAKKPREIVDVTVEWSVSKSTGKALSTQQGSGPDLLVAEELAAPMRTTTKVDPSTFPKASDYLLDSALDWLYDRVGAVGVWAAVIVLAFLSTGLGFSIGVTVGKRQDTA